MPRLYLVQIHRHGGWYDHSEHALLADALVMLRRLRADGQRARCVSRG